MKKEPIIILAALFVLWIIATGFWDRIGPAWATLWDTGKVGGGTKTGPQPGWPGFPKVPGLFDNPGKIWDFFKPTSVVTGYTPGIESAAINKTA